MAFDRSSVHHPVRAASSLRLVPSISLLGASVSAPVSMEFGFEIDGNRTPYHRHTVAVRRSVETGRLHIEIESFLHHDKVANPDNVCARAESGPVWRLGRAMFKLMPRGEWARLALKAGMGVGLYAEWVNDLELAYQHAGLENRAPTAGGLALVVVGV